MNFNESTTSIGKNQTLEDEDDEGFIDISNVDGDNPHNLPKDWIYYRHHPSNQITGNASDGVRTRLQNTNTKVLSCFVPTHEPKNIDEACNNESWLLTMQEELVQLSRNLVWDPVELPKGKDIID